MYRNTYAQIDLDNLNKNVSAIIKRYHNYQYYFGVVKANAYGHGLVKVASEIIKQGVNYLAVSSLDEALEIRNKMKFVSILCLEPIALKHIDIAIKNNITLTISSYDYYKELITMKLRKGLKVHVKVDSGMNRLGIKDKKELEEVVNTLLNHSDILMEGLYTHLSNTNSIDSSTFDDQINRLLSLTKDIDLNQIQIIHIYNSSALLNHPKLKMANGVRLGIAMYGINPIKHKEIDITLRPVLSLYSEVMEIKKVKENEYIGYNEYYQAKRDMLIGIVPIGYADGVSKKNSGRNVSINGTRYKIIDGVCMDMLTLYIDENVSIHDSVAIIGEVITVEDIAKYLGTTEYEVLTAINERVPRLYVKNSKQIFE